MIQQPDSGSLGIISHHRPPFPARIRFFKSATNAATQNPFLRWLREGKIRVLKRDQRLCYCPPHEIREDLYDKPEILWGVTAIVCRSTISSKINNQLQIVTFRNQNSLVDMAYLNEQKAAPKRDGYYSIPGLVPYLWLSNGTNITDRRTNRCSSKEGS